MKEKLISHNIPNYIKYFFILASVALTLYILVLIQSFIIPLLGAFVVAFMLKPFCDFMEKFKIPRSLGAGISVTLMIVIIFALIFCVFFQIKNVLLDKDILMNSMYTLINKIQQWTSGHFDLARNEQINYLKNFSTTVLKSGANFVQNTFSSTAVVFTEFVFFFISLFFFLYYRCFLVSFLFKYFDSSHHEKISIIIKSVQKMVGKYFLGISFVILITAFLNTMGLLILGIKHAVFFGVLAGTLTIIPYVGISIGALLPFLFALATTDSIWYPLGVVGIFGFVQFLEGNFITPKIIGSHIKINSFAALIALFFAGIFFGLVGIILSLPILAMIKIIADNVNCLKPLGFLLGNPPSITRLDTASFPKGVIFVKKLKLN